MRMHTAPMNISRQRSQHIKSPNRPAMIELMGVTEIIGAPGAGKTALALHAAHGLQTLYISSVALGRRAVPPRCLIGRLDTFLKLRIFIANDAARLVQAYALECIIIDGLDAFLHTVRKPRRLSGDVFRIVKTLKRLCFEHGTRVIITNDYYGGWRTDGCDIHNWYLGLRWCYAANSRYFVVRSEQGHRRITGSNGSTAGFVITNSGIAYE